jgi:hypothetical protein
VTETQYIQKVSTADTFKEFDQIFEVFDLLSTICFNQSHT